MFPPCRECMEIKKTGSWKMEKKTKLRIRPGGWAVLLLALLCALLCSCQSAAEPEAPDAQEQAAPLPEPEPEPEPEPDYHMHQNFMAASDGFFRPDEPLRRVDCAQLLYNLTQDMPRSAEPAQYDDVLPGYWYYEAVSAMGGYLPQEEGETRFFPGEAITPDAFVAALLAALGKTEQSAPPALLQAAQALTPDEDSPVYAVLDGVCYEPCPTAEGFQLLAPAGSELSLLVRTSGAFQRLQTALA